MKEKEKITNPKDIDESILMHEQALEAMRKRASEAARRLKEAKLKEINHQKEELKKRGPNAFVNDVPVPRANMFLIEPTKEMQELDKERIFALSECTQLIEKIEYLKALKR
jgi:hypothetical protein